MSRLVPRPWKTIATVAAGPVLAGVLASGFNIWYNLAHVRPLLSESQYGRFTQAITVYNLLAYPLTIALGVWILRPIFLALRAATQETPPEESLMERARRRAINLPWWLSALIFGAWAGCLPAFLWALNRDTAPTHPALAGHLTASLAIAMLIHITHAFFLTELLTARFVFPHLFQSHRPADTPGTWPLTLRRRGLMWAVSAVACPIGSLLLLILLEPIDRWFAFSVGAMGIVFGLIGAVLMSRLVARPVQILKNAAETVASGSLEVRVDLQRADEFGPLADAFNHMVEQMRQKEKLRRTFGLHVGERAAEHILAADPGLGGRACDLSILFCDIRSFTSRCQETEAQTIVQMLNHFFAEMVHVVEAEHHGLVNKFLGDGFMALFGAGVPRPDHAEAAVRCGLRMIQRMEAVNEQVTAIPCPPLEIGVGIHSGQAVVGNIGSDNRLEYTAIGQTVNVAARIESMTKVLSRPLLISDQTHQRLEGRLRCQPVGSHPLRGQDENLVLYAPDPD